MIDALDDHALACGFFGGHLPSSLNARRVVAEIPHRAQSDKPLQAPGGYPGMMEILDQSAGEIGFHRKRSALQKNMTFPWHPFFCPPAALSLIERRQKPRRADFDAGRVR
ncbi:MAG: hypothetical protein ACREE1_04955 [Stellaceae bacterium]